MAQQKYTIYKYVRLKGGWRYCPAALYANHTIKADVVIVGGKEEKHAEGNYYLASSGQWIPAGPDALKAQRQRHALLSGNSLEYERHSGRRSVPKAAVVQPGEPLADGRKRVNDEISKYLGQGNWQDGSSERALKSYWMSHLCTVRAHSLHII